MNAETHPEVDSPESAEKPRASEKPRRPFRRLLIGLGVGTAALVVLLAAVPYLVAWTPLKNVLLGRLVAGANMRASVERALFGWFAPLSMDGLSLANSDGEPLVDVAALRGERPWWQLLLSRPELGQFDIEQPHVDVVFDEKTTNFALVAGGGDRPAGNVPLLAANITGGSCDIRRRGEQEPVATLEDLNVSLRIEQTEDGRLLVIEPTGLLDHEPITPDMCNAGLQLVVPVLANATWVEGDVSLAVDKFLVPIGRGEESQIEGSLVLHAVEVGPKSPFLVKITRFVSFVLRREPPRKVCLADESHVRFRLGDRRIWHEGLAFGLPEVSPDLVIRTSGWVGLDESLDLTVEIPLPLDNLIDGPLAHLIGSRPLELQVTGTLDEPEIGFPDDNNPLAPLLGGLLGDAAAGEQDVADTVFGIIDRVRAPGDTDEAAPPIDVGDLWDRIRERRQENDGTLLPRRDRDGGDESEQPSPERGPLRGLFERILEDGEEERQE